MKRFKALPMTLAMLSLIVVVGLAPSAFARPRGDGFDRLTRLGERIDSLGLDDATRTAIHTTIAGAQAEQSKIRGELRDAYSGLRTLMRQDLPDGAAVSAQLDTIGVLQTEYKKQTTLAWLTALAQLTPDQRASLREAVRSHGGGRSDRGQ
jgi:Spy/CpxP family protein refolding chaperone